ncbi:hypothetical protein [uncultured Sphingomonas sp.]|uniref:hypothetical protein n=1 Tax=uncultured Sphingomonas sp. TaxID=158754 RepID=UPI0035C9E80A
MGLARNGSAHSASVFINCPFDRGYQPLFDAIVFAVAYCGFIVSSALEVVDSGELRLAKIVKLIEESSFSIHDISRIEPDGNTGLPRFNMPIELGIAIGMKYLGRKALREHRILVLDGALKTERFRYQAFASDLAGTDIGSHEGRPILAIEAVRDFLASAANYPVPHADAIGDALNEFELTLPEVALANKQRVEKLTFVDRYRHLANFIERSA